MSICSEEDIAATGCMGPKDCVYSHPYRCDLFIHCEVNADGVTGRPTVKDCPAGLEWNDHRKECDWPAAAGCAEKVLETLDTVAEAVLPSAGSLDSSFSCSDAAASQSGEIQGVEILPRLENSRMGKC